jgi:hypothetical protein
MIMPTIDCEIVDQTDLMVPRGVFKFDAVPRKGDLIELPGFGQRRFHVIGVVFRARGSVDFAVAPVRMDITE